MKNGVKDFLYILLEILIFNSEMGVCIPHQKKKSPSEIFLLFLVIEEQCPRVPIFCIPSDTEHPVNWKYTGCRVEMVLGRRKWQGLWGFQSVLGSTGLIKVRLGRLEWRLLPRLQFVLEFIFNLNMHIFKVDEMRPCWKGHIDNPEFQ